MNIYKTLIILSIKYVH